MAARPPAATCTLAEVMWLVVGLAIHSDWMLPKILYQPSGTQGTLTAKSPLVMLSLMLAGAVGKFVEFRKAWEVLGEP